MDFSCIFDCYSAVAFVNPFTPLKQIDDEKTGAAKGPNKFRMLRFAYIYVSYLIY